MTNYNLEDFKEWLEEKEFKNKHLLPEFFEMCQNKRIGLEDFASTNWGAYGWSSFGEPVTQLLIEWKTEIDNQVREQSELTQARTNLAQLEQTKTNLEREKSQLQAQITNLQQQVRNQGQTIREKQEALNRFQLEKNQLQNNLTQLKDQKETYQKSAEYLRETLKGTEKSLEEVKAELAQEQEKVKDLEKTQQTALESHQTELKNRSETYGVVQERNKELEKKLSASQTEVSQLSEWISKLEAVSGEGEGFAQLKKELEQANSQIISLQEELNSKKPRSYWWVYAILALVGLYLVMG